MPDVSQIYSSPWLSAEDLGDRSHDLTIREATLGEFKKDDGSKETKVVLSFRTQDGRDTQKKMIVNTMQYRALASITGSSNTDVWIGKRVMLSKVPATTKGKFTIAVSGVSQPAGEGVAQPAF